MFMLLGAVYLHRLPELEAQFGIDPLLLADKWPHILASVGIMAVPGLLAWGFDAAGRVALSAAAASAAAAAPAPAPATAGAAADSGAAAAAAAPPQPPLWARGPPAAFLSLSYGYLPLVWGATLAHYEAYFLGEAGTLLPAAARTVGLEALAPSLPALVAHPAVTAFVQGGTLLASAGLAAALTRRLAGKPWASVAPQCAAIALFTAELWHLIVGSDIIR